MTEINLTAREPFSLYAVAFSHGWIQLMPFCLNGNRGDFTYILRLSSGRVIELAVLEAPGGVTVQVQDSLSPVETEETLRTIRWMLGLDQNFSSFYTLAREEPKLANVETQARGRVLRSATLFEDVIKTILTTNTLWGGTKRMVSNLVEQFGDPSPSNPARRAFPTAEQLAESDEQTLRSVSRLGYRAPYVLELARRVSSGNLDLEAYKTAPLPTQELRKQLRSIKGIGDYAVANLLMLLGHYDFIPIDSWAMKMVSQEWYGGAPVGPADVQGAFERWGEWKGLAYWFWDWTQKD